VQLRPLLVEAFLADFGGGDTSFVPVVV
jgi:hypothetical protein